MPRGARSILSGIMMIEEDTIQASAAQAMRCGDSGRRCVVATASYSVAASSSSSHQHHHGGGGSGSAEPCVRN